MGNLLVAGMEKALGYYPRNSTHPDPESPSRLYVLKTWPNGRGTRVLRLRCHTCNHVYTKEVSR